MFRNHPIFVLSALTGSSYLFALDEKPAMHLASVRQVFTHILTRSPWHCVSVTDSHQPPRARRDGVLVPAGLDTRVRYGANAFCGWAQPAAAG